MARYIDEAAAAADGFNIAHEPDRQRFALYLDAPDAPDAPETPDAPEADRELAGFAHYSFPREGHVDFDSTVVDPKFRGTGLSGLLAHHALTSEVATSHTILASCWFIEKYLEKHPELRSSTGESSAS